MIRVQVETRVEDKVQYKNYLVHLETKVQNTVSQFIEHIREVCQLDNRDYEMSFDGFVLPLGQSTRMIKRECSKHNSVFTIRAKYEEEKEEIREEIVKTNISKHQRKQLKKLEKKLANAKLAQQKPFNSSESSEEEQEQIKQRESSKKKVKKSTKDPQFKPKWKESYNNKVILQQIATHTRSHHHQQKPEQSSFSSSDSESLPHIEHKPQPKILKPIESTQKNQSKSQPQTSAPLPTRGRGRPSRKKKNVVIADSSSQSPPSQANQQKIHPSAIQSISQAPITLMTRSQHISSISSVPLKFSPQKFSQKPQQIMKIPPALRRPVIKSFKSYKQQQWLPVSDTAITKYKQAGHKTFCQPSNNIRFKTLELDEEKFVPILSGWVAGEVSWIEENGKVILKNVTEEGKGFKVEYCIQEINMSGLELHRLQALPQQLALLELEAKVQAQTKQNNVETVTNEPTATITPIQQRNSLEKFICGQTNYYFSDKSYNNDLYMQMHANQHPSKYLAISFLLNFPKIKKHLRDQQQLWRYLYEDEDKFNRNYELNQVNHMIRKKTVCEHTEREQEDKKEAGDTVHLEKVGGTRNEESVIPTW